jgi:hypothetical protein
MFLFERTGAALAMATATAAMSLMAVGFVLLLLVAAFAFDVSCPRLAQAAAVSTLRDWAAFFIDVGQRAV